MSQFVKKNLILYILIFFQVACATYKVEKLVEHSELSLQNTESAISIIEKDYQNKLSIISGLQSDIQNLDSSLYKIISYEFQNMTRLRSEINEQKEQVYNYNKFFNQVGRAKLYIKKGDADYQKVLQYRKASSGWDKNIENTFNHYSEHSKKLNKLFLDNQIYLLEPKRLSQETQVFRRKIERTTRLNQLQIEESLRRRQSIDEKAKGESQRLLIELQNLLERIQQDLNKLIEAEGELKSHFVENNEKIIITRSHPAHKVVLKIKKYGLKIQGHIKIFNNLKSEL